MAQIIQHPHAGKPPVIQTRTRGRLPKRVTSLWRIRSDRSYASYCARVMQEEIQKKLTAAAEWEKVGNMLSYDAAALQSRFQRGEI